MHKSRPSTIHDSRYQSAIYTLIKARKAANLSQALLAKRIGLTQPDVSKIERLERRLDITEFLDMLYIITGNDNAKIDLILGEIREGHSRPSACRTDTSPGDL